MSRCEVPRRGNGGSGSSPASSVAFAASTWINNKIKHESGGQIVDDTQVVLAADGSATQIAEIEQSLSGSNQPNSFDYHAPKNHTVRFIDAEGQEMSVEVTLEGTHNHYQVTPRPLPPSPTASCTTHGFPIHPMQQHKRTAFGLTVATSPTATTKMNSASQSACQPARR